MTDTQRPEGNRPVLVAGATGYIGGRLIPRLLEAGHRVRAMVRTPAKLSNRPWSDHPSLEVVRGDLLDRESMMAAARDAGRPTTWCTRWRAKSPISPTSIGGPRETWPMPRPPEAWSGSSTSAASARKATG